MMDVILMAMYNDIGHEMVYLTNMPFCFFYLLSNLSH